MDLHLKGKKALVSGSTAGIGFAAALGLAEEGASVIINGRTAKRVEAALALIRKSVPQADVSGVAADLGTADGVAEMLKRVPTLDILVNNLGIFEPKAFNDIPDADWMRFFEVNVLSGIRLSRAYLPGMRERDWGRILFISSESALQIPAEMIHYGMTKTAQLAVARGLAESLAGTKITVNAVLPGPTSSEGVSLFVDQMGKAQKKSAGEVEKDFFQTIRPSSLLKRFATPAEVAHLIVYLCSDRASATTGAALRVDGGVVRSIV